MSQRPGFNVPNSVDVSAGDLAEPDSGDFSVLGNHRNGVITGCTFTFNGTSGEFQIATAGLVLLDNAPVAVPSGGATTVTAGGPKFSLIVWTATGLGQVVGDIDADNPVFPDLPEAAVVLASVYVPATGLMVAVDKRQLLTNGVFGSRTTGQDFIQHQYEGSVNFAVDSSGDVRWGPSGPTLGTGPAGLTTDASLNVDGSLDVGLNATVGGDVTAEGEVTATNLQRGTGVPDDGDGAAGDLYQRYTTSPSGVGQLYFHDGDGWTSISPAPVPVGTVITSVVPPAQSLDNLGPSWKALNGQTLAAASTTYADLWAVVPASWKSTEGDTITLPDMADRFVRGAASGDAALSAGTGSVVLTEANIPSHKHFDTTATGGKIRTKTVPGHSHTGSTAVQGTTAATGGNHRHPGVDGYTGGGFVFTDLNGRNKLDGYFNDSSHTASVSWGQVGISGPTTANGAHGHSLSITEDGGAANGIELATPEKTYGSISPTPVPVVPAHLTLYHYIRV